MLPRNISNNMLVGNYGGGNGCVDNDDGSLWFDNNHNFAVYGHQKFKVGAIRSFGNVLAYVNPEFAGSWSAVGAQLNRANDMWENVVVFTNATGYYHSCGPWSGRNSRLYATGGVAVHGADCDNKFYSLAEWQARDPMNNDPGTTANTTLPRGFEIVAWGRALVGM